MWYLHFILNASLPDISLLKNTALKQQKHLHMCKANIISHFHKTSQDGIPANYCSSQVSRHSTHGNLTTLNYKNQINTFKRHVIKT